MLKSRVIQKGGRGPHLGSCSRTCWPAPPPAWTGWPEGWGRIRDPAGKQRLRRGLLQGAPHTSTVAGASMAVTGRRQGRRPCTHRQHIARVVQVHSCMDGSAHVHRAPEALVSVKDLHGVVRWHVAKCVSWWVADIAAGRHASYLASCTMHAQRLLNIKHAHACAHACKKTCVSIP